ncbi:MAG TPA: PhoX family phosphatase [Methyloceanibacter sp.]|nr:PhoX family phosphatase [Methyloceanibacter sp.]
MGVSSAIVFRFVNLSSAPHRLARKFLAGHMANSDKFCNRAEAYEAHDNVPLSPPGGEAIGDIILRRYSRREMMRGTLGVAAAVTLFGPSLLAGRSARAESAPDRFCFHEIAAGVDETHHVAEGYQADVLFRWGDALFSDSPDFDPLKQSAAAQLKQFGYNNDYIAFFPLNDDGSRGLLCVNHEYTNEEIMFPNLVRQDLICFTDMTAALVDIEMAAHGVSIVEIGRENGRWRPVLDGKYNRRISPANTTMSVDGPAAGHDRLRTSSDPSGMQILGTLNNCAGGITPWGTYLTAEENFHGYFWSDLCKTGGKPPDGLGGDHAKSYARYGVPGLWQAWGKFVDRFNVDKEPNEPNRFGWIVEIDPLDANSVPVKHTALGRFRHEGAECVLNKDGRVVVYCGDDARFDYVYRFVTEGAYNPDDRKANMSLLSAGTLSVAKFKDDGKVEWLPLVFGQGPLTPDNGFHSQADVVIDARLAADALGATRMDRPEDVQPNPVNGRVYVILTNNKDRKAGEEDPANPRAENVFGHIIEMTPPDGDHAAKEASWDVLVRCGDPAVAAVGALWNPDISDNGWFACPDNAAVDAQGRLWISTDQGEPWPTGRADGLYALETEGERRRTGKLFFRCPVGAEMCGPCFTPDQETLFLAVQHPSADATERYKGFERASTFADPATRWPDFKPDMPPRPSVLAITKIGGGKIA